MGGDRGHEERSAIREGLLQQWGSEANINWIAISANIFDIRPATDQKLSIADVCLEI